MKGKTYLAFLRGSKQPLMITLSNAKVYYRYGTSEVIHHDQIQYVYVVDKMETSCVPFAVFEQYYVK